MMMIMIMIMIMIIRTRRTTLGNKTRIVFETPSQGDGGRAEVYHRALFNSVVDGGDW
jgi:hypothetical protein